MASWCACLTAMAVLVGAPFRCSPRRPRPDGAGDRPLAERRPEDREKEWDRHAHRAVGMHGAAEDRLHVVVRSGLGENGNRTRARRSPGPSCASTRSPRSPRSRAPRRPRSFRGRRTPHGRSTPPRAPSPTSQSPGENLDRRSDGYRLSLLLTEAYGATVESGTPLVLTDRPPSPKRRRLPDGRGGDRMWHGPVSHPQKGRLKQSCEYFDVAPRARRRRRSAPSRRETYSTVLRVAQYVTPVGK